jgi:hypothetical protein
VCKADLEHATQQSASLARPPVIERKRDLSAPMIRVVSPLYASSSQFVLGAAEEGSHSADYPAREEDDDYDERYCERAR